jgi:hypothetical protein
VAARVATPEERPNLVSGSTGKTLAKGMYMAQFRDVVVRLKAMNGVAPLGIAEVAEASLAERDVDLDRKVLADLTVRLTFAADGALVEEVLNALRFGEGSLFPGAEIQQVTIHPADGSELMSLCLTTSDRFTHGDLEALLEAARRAGVSWSLLRAAPNPLMDRTPVSALSQPASVSATKALMMSVTKTIGPRRLGTMLLAPASLLQRVLSDWGAFMVGRGVDEAGGLLRELQGRDDLQALLSAAATPDGGFVYVWRAAGSPASKDNTKHDSNRGAKD